MLEKIYLILEDYKTIKVYHSFAANNLNELVKEESDLVFKHYLDGKDYAKNLYVEGGSWEEKAKRYFEIIFKTQDIIIEDNLVDGTLQKIVKLAVTADGQPCKKIDTLSKNNTILIHEYAFNVLAPYIKS